MSIENVKNLLTGYNKTYRMSKALDTGTFASNGVLQTTVTRADGTTTVFKERTVPEVVETLAALGLYSLIENDRSPEAVRVRLAQVSAGSFAQRRNSEVDTVPDIPTSISDLTLEEIKAATGLKEKTTFPTQLTLVELISSGRYDLLPAEEKAKLESVIELRAADAQAVTVLNELFSIAKASTAEKTAEEQIFDCLVPAHRWPGVLAKVQSDPDLGYRIPADSMSLDDTCLNIKFKLVKTFAGKDTGND